MNQTETLHLSNLQVLKTKHKKHIATLQAEIKAHKQAIADIDTQVLEMEKELLTWFKSNPEVNLGALSEAVDVEYVKPTNFVTEISDVNLLPHEFVTEKLVVSKIDIKRAILAGKPVNGAILIPSKPYLKYHFKH